MASTKARSLTKAVTWRVFSTLVTTAFVYLVTRQVVFAVAFLAFESIAMTFLYYLHERAWKGVKWGKFPTDWTKYGWEHKEEDKDVSPKR